MDCRLYGLQTVWSTDCMVRRLYVLQTVWFAAYMVYKLYCVCVLHGLQYVLLGGCKPAGCTACRLSWAKLPKGYGGRQPPLEDQNFDFIPILKEQIGAWRSKAF